MVDPSEFVSTDESLDYDLETLHPLSLEELDELESLHSDYRGIEEVVNELGIKFDDE